MPPRDMLVVNWPLESVNPLAGSTITPGAAANSTSAPATAVPCWSLTWTTTGCGNNAPVWTNCLPPLDSTIAAPKAVGLGSGANSDLREQEVATMAMLRMRSTEATRFISLPPPVFLLSFERLGTQSAHPHPHHSWLDLAQSFPAAMPVGASSTGISMRR